MNKHMQDSAPKVAIGPPSPKANVAIPICSIDEYENILLMSFCRSREKAGNQYGDKTETHQ